MLVLRSKLTSKNKVSAINTFAVPVIRYPAAVVTWRRGDLKETDIGTRKLMTMHGVFHPKSSTAILPIQTDKHLLHNRPDIVLINYKKQTGLIIDIAVPRDKNIQSKKLEKIDNYQSLKLS